MEEGGQIVIEKIYEIARRRLTHERGIFIIPWHDRPPLAGLSKRFRVWPGSDRSEHSAFARDEHRPEVACLFVVYKDSLHSSCTLSVCSGSQQTLQFAWIEGKAKFQQHAVVFTIPLRQCMTVLRVPADSTWTSAYQGQSFP
jgi:hypothetical protein